METKTSHSNSHRAECRNRSLWLEGAANEPTHPPLREKKKADVLIVGGGLAGLLCAHRLAHMGLSCTVLEAGIVGGGVTHSTSAKLTAQHGLLYAKLIKQRGKDAAALYHRGNQWAIEEYRNLGTDCDLQDKTAYVFHKTDQSSLDEEAEAYRQLGIPYHMTENTQLPFSVAGALGMEGQAQFHPLKFLAGLTGSYQVYEDSRVQAIEGNRAITAHGSVLADHIMLATHFPMVNLRGLYFMKMYQHRSYVLALKGAPDMGGMYIDAEENGFSFRNHGEHLLLGGGGHKTGGTGGGFGMLRGLAGQAYPDAESTHAWATQDCMTLDGLPYIGRHSSKNRNLYVATGFQKWGMTSAMLAARTLSDLIVSGSSEFETLFSPQRPLYLPQLAKNIGSSLSGLVRFGKRCTHMGCALRWNAAERSWDCPCHGSRFDENGRVLDNPAQKEL